MKSRSLCYDLDRAYVFVPGQIVREYTSLTVSTQERILRLWHSVRALPFGSPYSAGAGVLGFSIRRKSREDLLADWGAFLAADSTLSEVERDSMFALLSEAVGLPNSPEPEVTRC